MEPQSSAWSLKPCTSCESLEGTLFCVIMHFGKNNTSEAIHQCLVVIMLDGTFSPYIKQQALAPFSSPSLHSSIHSFFNKSFVLARPFISISLRQISSYLHF